MAKLRETNFSAKGCKGLRLTREHNKMLSFKIPDFVFLSGGTKDWRKESQRKPKERYDCERDTLWLVNVDEIASFYQNVTYNLSRSLGSLSTWRRNRTCRRLGCSAAAYSSAFWWACVRARRTKACGRSSTSKRSNALLGWLRYLLRLVKVHSIVSKALSCSSAL